MSGIVISSGLVIGAGVDNLNANSPIIGYDNILTTDNVVATTEEADNPVTNLANVSTALYWKSGAGSPTSDEYITITPTTADDIDYIAIARHNLATAQCAVGVEAIVTTTWEELVSAVILPDDGPVIFRFDKAPYEGIRLRIQESLNGTTPQIAVMYCGELLLLQRRLYVGHTPINLGRHTSIVSNRSMNGQFLGRIVIGQRRVTSVQLQNLTPTWYRTYFDPFVIAAQEIPFFFGWRPGDYPYECGFAWLAGDPIPQNQLANGMMQVSLDLEGVA